MSAPVIHHERITGDGVQLHVARAGSGPPVILLHGFPENWTSWRHQIVALANAGFSVWAPDLRGYNLSDQPTQRSAYHLRHLVADVAALVRKTGEPRAHIVGHDWEGIVAWTFAGQHADLVNKLVILNAPHMRIYLEKVRRPPQMLKSWYVLFFQVPKLPERALAARKFRAIRKMFEHTPARRGAFSTEDIAGYIEGLSKPGALTAALDYYRENLQSNGVTMASSAYIEAPTLVIWGEKDPALATELLDGLDRVVPHLQIHRIPDAGHWVQNEAAEEVNRVMISFLRS